MGQNKLPKWAKISCQSHGILPLAAQAVRNVGRRYQQGGLERALYEKQRPGQPRCSTTVRNNGSSPGCSSPPEGSARWTVRLVAEEAVRRKVSNPRQGRVASHRRLE